MNEPHALGKSGEAAAVSYLEKKKFTIVERGFRFLRGEIDIIAYDRGTLVFIEVKTRQSEEFGLPEESVTPSKQRQLRKVAEGYLALRNVKDTPCRFDIISLIPEKGRRHRIRHIRDAF